MWPLTNSVISRMVDGIAKDAEYMESSKETAATIGGGTNGHN